MERYNFLLDLLVSNHHPVLLAGAPGVGKTSLIQQLVLPKHTSSTVTMSHGLTAARLQTSIIGHILEIQSRAMGVMPGPGAGGAGSQAKQSHLFFIDDLSMAPTVGGGWAAAWSLSTLIFFLGEGVGEVMFGSVRRARFAEKSFHVSGYQWFDLIKCDVVVCAGYR